MVGAHKAREDGPKGGVGAGDDDAQTFIGLLGCALRGPEVGDVRLGLDFAYRRRFSRAQACFRDFVYGA